MARKTFNEKLLKKGDLPKVEILTDPIAIERYGGTHMAIAPAIDYDELMRKIPEGNIITTAELRKNIANKYKADFTCPLTAGIFINVVAHASKEREQTGSKDLVPYHRTLKKDGELNEKYPNTLDELKILLELEGHEVIKKGKKYFVKNYEEKMYKL